MYSPFYTAELKRLYPHRVTASDPKEIASILKTIPGAENMKIEYLTTHYFPCATSWNILNAFKLLNTNI